MGGGGAIPAFFLVFITQKDAFLGFIPTKSYTPIVMQFLIFPFPLLFLLFSLQLYFSPVAQGERLGEPADRQL